MTGGERPTLVIVGGFLGAGKTTLLLKAATLLDARGVRTALVTNDQGVDLVDTQYASVTGVDTQEVCGGCFCCRLTDFVHRAEALAAHGPRVLFAEPVGSCMDLSATVVHPLMQLYGDRFRVAPYTVLVDPHRAVELLHPDADPLLSYLFRNQLAEADIICSTKADLPIDAPEIPGVAHRLSALTGEGVAAWLDETLDGELAVGARVLDIDYQRYAKAEAMLGWLNWRADVRVGPALSPAAVVGPLLDQLDGALTAAGISIVHMKLFDDSPSGFLRAGICSHGEEPSVQGALLASPAEHHNLTLNLRARANPGALRAIVEDVTSRLPGRVDVLRFEAFAPAPPRPEVRLP